MKTTNWAARPTRATKHNTIVEQVSRFRITISRPDGGTMLLCFDDVTEAIRFAHAAIIAAIGRLTEGDYRHHDHEPTVLEQTRGLERDLETYRRLLENDVLGVLGETQ